MAAAIQTLAKESIAKAKREYVRRHARPDKISRLTVEGRNKYYRWRNKKGLEPAKRKRNKKGSETDTQEPGMPKGRK